MCFTKYNKLIKNKINKSYYTLTNNKINIRFFYTLINK